MWAPRICPSDLLGWFFPSRDSSLTRMWESVLCTRLTVYRDPALLCAVLSFQSSSLRILSLLTTLNSEVHLLKVGRPPGSAWVPLSALPTGNPPSNHLGPPLSRTILQCPCLISWKPLCYYILSHWLVVPGKPYPFNHPQLEVDVL